METLIQFVYESLERICAYKGPARVIPECFHFRKSCTIKYYIHWFVGRFYTIFKSVRDLRVYMSTAIVYLQRIKRTYDINEGNVMCLFLCAVVISLKFHNDNPISNYSLSEYMSVPPQLLARVEIEFCILIDWHLFTTSKYSKNERHLRRRSFN